jgi:hypothetical protein
MPFGLPITSQGAVNMKRTTILLVAILCFTPVSRAADAEETVKEYLKSIKGENARVAVIKDDALAKAFPKHAFVSVIYPQFPVARQSPEPLQAGNVIAVPSEGKVVPLSDVKQLEKFFVEKAPKADAKVGETILNAWLRLSQELAQDGFYRFNPPLESAGAASSDGKMQLSAAVKVDPAGGNKGEIKATIHFDKGTIVKIDHKVDLSPGPRPRCQATKLLDADPIVRQMAEDSIRVMGSACKYYLDEQRAKADPALQKAIDRIWQRILEEGR